jgi:hypothetical protein
LAYSDKYKCTEQAATYIAALGFRSSDWKILLGAPNFGLKNHFLAGCVLRGKFGMLRGATLCGEPLCGGTI